jgi:hypothetical protein
MAYSPLEAIRRHCKQCSGGSLKNVTTCDINNCPLYAFRLGHNPNRKKIGNIRNLKHEDIKPVQSVTSQKIRKKIPTEQPNFSKRMDLKGNTQSLHNETNGGK